MPTKMTLKKKLSWRFPLFWCHLRPSQALGLEQIGKAGRRQVSLGTLLRTVAIAFVQGSQERQSQRRSITVFLTTTHMRCQSFILSSTGIEKQRGEKQPITNHNQYPRTRNFLPPDPPVRSASTPFISIDRVLDDVAPRWKDRSVEKIKGRRKGKQLSKARRRSHYAVPLINGIISARDDDASTHAPRILHTRHRNLGREERSRSAPVLLAVRSVVRPPDRSKGVTTSSFASARRGV
jgi:hypothetical protein